MNWLDGKKLLVPIDFGDLSRKAVDTALDMATLQSDVEVIHVVPDLNTMAPEVLWQDISDAMRRSAVEQTFRKEFNEKKYHDLKFHVAFGDAGHQIADYAEEIGADIIVIPSHGRTGLKRLLIGSVAERVLRLAHCTVVVVKEKRKHD